MKLYEYEGKNLLREAGLKTPRGQVVESPAEAEKVASEIGSTIAKCQILGGKRGKAGGILSCPDAAAAKKAVESILQMKIRGEQVKKVLVEEKLDIAKECYLGITYQNRTPVVIACFEGGMDIEEVKNVHPDKVVAQPVRITRGFDETDAIEVLQRAGFDEDSAKVAKILVAMYDFFVKNDALLVEVNPLIKTKSGEWYVADSKMEIDEEAEFRLPIELPDRLGSGKAPSRLEISARENDQMDNRGAAGRMFYEIEGGNIIVLAAGGGTSMEALDDLYSLGGRPAIFTEYSGNPTGEKVKGLTKIALQFPGDIDAIWVIGGRANFTDVYESLVNGILAGIRENDDFDKTTPIIVRRAGPRDEEAYEVFRQARDEEGYNIFIRGMGTSIPDSARMVIYQANKHYAARKRAAQ
ncbi:MAG: acetate--CoA ligase family protein [Armatimonadetes bacterium]|nr:acetate--CoA ligase family protein [Armatimonadota bacterium]